MRKSKLRFWGFLAPALIAFCIVVIIPTCIGIFYSLTYWNGIVGSDIKFVGFQNFIDIFILLFIWSLGVVLFSRGSRQ